MAAKPTQRQKTFVYGHSRFYVDRPTGPAEDWEQITIKGKREYISSIDPERSALIIVDMQKISMGWSKLPGELGKAHRERTKNIVIPNLKRLIADFRKRDQVIVYLTLTPDEILPEIAPSPERMAKNREYVVVKYTGGAFATSGLDNLLRENGIATLFMTGTDTAGCVNLTFAEAFDKSYQTILIEDACMSGRQDLHEAAVKIWSYMAFVRSTDQVINDYPWQKWIHPETVDK